MVQFTAQQIALMVGGTVEGNGEAVVSTFAKIEEGRPGALTFLANPKYTHHLYNTQASVVLVRRDLELTDTVTATLIRVDDPYATLAQLMTMAQQALNPARRGLEEPVAVASDVEVPDDAYIGTFAYIGKGVKLGAGVQIYPQVYIGDGCTIGAGTTLYAGAKVYAGCKIGERCIIHSGAVIGADGFGFAPVGERYEKLPQMGIVEIGNDVEIGANTTVDRATMGATRVADGVKLDNLIQIAHNVTVGENTVMASQSGVAGSSHIGRHCMLGGQVGVAGHISIADGVQIGAQSGIPNSIKQPGARMMGSPVTDFGTYARMQVLLKRLPEMAQYIAEQQKQ